MTDRAEVNGISASAEDLASLAVLNYGHYTAMQVRHGAVRGLDLHLDRLDQQSRELFGQGLDRDEVLGHLRHALGSADADASVRVIVFRRGQGRGHGNDPGRLDVLVIVRPPVERSDDPLRVRSVRYERTLAHIKHIGTFGQLHHRELAVRAGFDDAVFVDHQHRITEGSTWNICFFDGTEVIWPAGPLLVGTGMRLVQAGLAAKGVPFRTRSVPASELPSFRAAFVIGSNTPGRPIVAVDDTTYPVDQELTDLLHDCYRTNPWQPVQRISG